MIFTLHQIHDIAIGPHARGRLWRTDLTDPEEALRLMKDAIERADLEMLIPEFGILRIGEIITAGELEVDGVWAISTFYGHSDDARWDNPSSAAYAIRWFNHQEQYHRRYRLRDFY